MKHAKSKVIAELEAVMKQKKHWLAQNQKKVNKQQLFKEI